MHLVLDGEVEISMKECAGPVGVVRGGECLGEVSLLAGTAHSATATAKTRVETGTLDEVEINGLIRLRPDTGLAFTGTLRLRPEKSWSGQMWRLRAGN